MCDCSRFSIDDRFSADVDFGFRPVSIFNHLSCPPIQPVSAGPTDIQQTTFAVSISFRLVFKWFSTLVRWQFEQTQQVFSRLCWQFFNRFFNWSSNRFSTSCDWLAVEFSRYDGNALPQTVATQTGNAQIDGAIYFGALKKRQVTNTGP